MQDCCSTQAKCRAYIKAQSHQKPKFPCPAGVASVALCQCLSCLSVVPGVVQYQCAASLKHTTTMCRGLGPRWTPGTGVLRSTAHSHKPQSLPMRQCSMLAPRSSRWPLRLSSSRQASGSLGVQGLRSCCQTLGQSCSGLRGRPGALKVGGFSSCPAECFLGHRTDAAPQRRRVRSS